MPNVKMKIPRGGLALFASKTLCESLIQACIGAAEYESACVGIGWIPCLTRTLPNARYGCVCIVSVEQTSYDCVTITYQVPEMRSIERLCRIIDQAAELTNSFWMSSGEATHGDAAMSTTCSAHRVGQIVFAFGHLGAHQ